MAIDRQRNALQVIFSFFLGLMVTAFIGVGVNTFYPTPETRYQDELQTLYREQEDINMGRTPSGQLSPADETRLKEISDDIRQREDDQQEYRDTWARNTSMILIVFATLVMGISLVRSDQLRIISNGLLLGGLFTMVYGVGWVIAGGVSWVRFAVMTFALAVTFALGYLRFVRIRAEERAAVHEEATAYAPSGAEVSSLEARVGALEKRIAAAASAFGEPEER